MHNVGAIVLDIALVLAFEGNGLFFSSYSRVPNQPRQARHPSIELSKPSLANDSNFCSAYSKHLHCYDSDFFYLCDELVAVV